MSKVSSQQYCFTWKFELKNHILENSAPLEIYLGEVKDCILMSSMYHFRLLWLYVIQVTLFHLISKVTHSSFLYFQNINLPVPSRVQFLADVVPFIPVLRLANGIPPSHQNFQRLSGIFCPANILLGLNFSTNFTILQKQKIYRKLIRNETLRIISYTVRTF